MINTQTQIDSLIDLAVLQRTELKQLVDSLPQLRDHLSSEIERNLEEIEPAIRSELEQFVAARALDTQAKTSAELSAKLDAMARNLESTTAAKYSVLMAERAQNATLLAQAEARIAEAASALPGAVKGIVTDELSRFPRAGEIDQLRKEFAEPRGLNPRGRWQVGDTYNKLDLVSYNGDSYVSNTDGNREKPSRSSEAWTLSAARGNGGAGGGVTSLTDLVAVPANGELLIGNGSAFVNSTLTAGTGVTITNGPGTITIDASGAQEVLTATVTNAESFAITRGQVVYLFGATGNRASVKLANNSADATSAKTFGVVSETSIAAGGTGLITCVGVVDKLMLGAYNDGDTLYLGDTPGSVTATKPYAPNHLVYVGMVERANNGNGELYVRIQNGFELDEIHDVQITTPPLAGALLMRDATTSLWKANRLTGTANQVTVTNADTAVTLSLPTAIANVNSVTAATTQNLTLAGGSTGASLVLGQGASGNLVMSANSAERARLTATGNLLIGTTESAHGYRMFASNQTDNAYIAVSNQSGAAGTRSLRMGFASAATTATIQGTRVGVADDINVAIQAGGGNILIGTTTDGGQKLQVNGSASFAEAITVTSSAGLAASFTNATDNNWSAKIIKSGGNELQLSGNITANSGPSIRAVTTGGAAYAPLTVDGSTFTAKISSVAALTIASNQAATFAGSVTAADSGFILNSGGSMLHSSNSVYLSAPTSLVFRTNAATPTPRLTLTDTAATFAGAVTVTGSGSSSDSFKITGDTAGIGLQVGTTGTVNLYRAAADKWATDDAFSVGGAFTPLGNIYFPTNSNLTSSGSIGTQASAGLSLWSKTGSIYDFTIYDAAGNLAVTMPTGTRNLSIASTTPSTGAGSGALQVAGGIYAGAASYFGGAATIRSISTAISSITPATNLDIFDTNDSATRLWRSSSEWLQIAAARGGFTGQNNVFLFDIVGPSAPTLRSLKFRQSSNGGSTFTDVLTLDASANATFGGSVSAGAATFTGAVAIGNTVATAAGVASTHKVTMVIGGVTYYLLASNV